MIILKSKTKRNILIGLLVMTAIVWTFVFAEAEQDNILEINFFDIGQGDAIFIETPNHKQILIDGGPSLVILDKLGKQMPFYDRYIDLVILTHPEYDHINGLIEVIKRYNVGGIVTNGVIRDTNQYKSWINIIEQENIPIYIAKLGGQIHLEDNIKMDILYPFEGLMGKKIKWTNNTSIVGKLIYKDFETLLTGDIQKKIERELVDSEINLKADVLKIPHHGSKTSSTIEFLRGVDSLVNIIQAGKDNRYNHPHKEVLNRMNNYLVTGWSGGIKVLTNGKNFLIKK